MTDHAAGRPRRAPTHPGAILRDDVIPQEAYDIWEARQTLGDELERIPTL